MDPMVGSSAATEWSDNAELLDFCFLCSRQFFHDNLDNYGTERLKDEDVLETFFEELGRIRMTLTKSYNVKYCLMTIFTQGFVTCRSG